MRRARRSTAQPVAAAAIASVCLAVVAAAQTEPRQAVDVVLVLDNSGSMRANDPNRLLRQAVSEFAALLPADSQMAIVLFDERVELVLGLTPVSDASFQSGVAESLTRVDFSGNWTDIAGGIERGIYTLTREGRPEALPALVFFTDGIIDTGDRARDLERGRWLRDDLAAEATQRGIRIFGVAFTEAADYQLIQSVAQITGGEHYRVLDAPEIAGALARIRARVLAPPPIAAASPGPVAFVPQESSWTWRPIATAVLAFALLSLVGVSLVRRTASGSPESQEVPPADAAHLIDVGRHTGADRIPLRKRRIRFGRDAGVNDISIAHDTISSQHATIDYREGAFFLRDLRSSNGTFVNGKRASDPDAVRETLLKSGDRIRFDAYEFVFTLDALAGDTVPGAGPEPERRGTVLRREAPPRPAEAPVAAPPAQGAPAETLFRPEFCPIHPAWKATELCAVCGTGKCQQCMTEKGGTAMCRDCAARASA
jgi:pSer/pThr/pTyr-binding forkhead associated (FHA) protein/Mg-chelatase subunit ChlD